MASWYMCRCNFIYADKKSTAFQNFTKLTCTLYADLVYQISPKFYNKCEKYEFKLIYAPA
jgi:hypothetical protein